jgi:hypothetical protein
MRYACPKCRSSDHLFRYSEVPAWEAVDRLLRPKRIGKPFHEAMWDQAVPTGTFGCSECALEVPQRDLLKLDDDGRELASWSDASTNVGERRVFGE